MLFYITYYIFQDTVARMMPPLIVAINTHIQSQTNIRSLEEPFSKNKFIWSLIDINFTCFSANKITHEICRWNGKRMRCVRATGINRTAGITAIMQRQSKTIRSKNNEDVREYVMMWLRPHCRKVKNVIEAIFFSAASLTWLTNLLSLEWHANWSVLIFWVQTTI